MISDIFRYSSCGNGACPSCGGSQLSALTDPKGNTWSFNYDQYARLTETANPLGQKKTYQYDKMSRVTEVKDPAGNITTFTYDALNRLTKKDIHTPAGEQSITDYTYDAVGNLLSASNASSSVSFVYDALNRVVETAQAFGGKSYTVGYAYDAAGNRIAMATPWGRYSYTYDALNRVTGIVNPQGITIAFGYDAVGRRTKKTVFKNAPELLAETAYTYDAAGQLLSIVNKAGGKVVDFTNYEYDAAGNRVKKEDRDGVIKYRYDASNRLITAEPVPMNMAEAEVFIYDRNGNRRYDRGAWDYKYDAANRLLENSTYTYTHDLNGNLTGLTKKDDSSAITYAYNPEQQLSEVTTPEHKVHYRYDPLGRRIEKAVDGNIQRYVYDNEDIIAVLDGSNSPTEIFTHGPGIDEPLTMTKADGKNYFYHTDGLGSIKAITDDSNQTIETYTYKSYGEPTIRDYTGAILPKSAIANPCFFTARELDSEAGLYYLRHRYYDWRRGVFIQEDPVGFAGSVNKYIYADNLPITKTDPSGLSSLIFDVSDGVLLVYTERAPLSSILTFPASNNVTQPNANPYLPEGHGHIPFGTFTVGSYRYRGTDSNSAYGIGSFYINITIDLPYRRRENLLIHSGRRSSCDAANRCGYNYATLGCIRTTDEAIELLVYDRPTSITIRQ